MIPDIQPTTLTQMIFDLSEGDDDFVADAMESFNLIPPSGEGMQLERALSDVRMKWASAYADIINALSIVAAEITVRPTLEESEDPELLNEEIAEAAAVIRAAATAIFGHIAQHEFEQRHSNCQTSG